MADFAAALEEVKPAFGAQREALESYCTGGMISSGPLCFEHLLSTVPPPD